MKLSLIIDGFLLAKQVAGCSPNTLRNYKHNLKRFRAFFDTDPDLAEITANDIRRFLQHLMSARFAPSGIAKRPIQKLGAKTLRNVHTCLSSVWTWAIAEGYATSHIIRTVKAPKPEAPAIEPLSQQQVRAVLNATKYSAPWSTSPETQTELPHTQQLRDRAIILFLVDTGVRASELCNLLVGDVDLAAGSATVRGKGRLNTGQGKSRIVRLGTRLRKALWTYLAERNALNAKEQPLFITRNGTGLKRRALHTHISRIGKRAGIDHVYPHRFRHTFAIMYLRNGGDIYTLQALLGHTSLDMVKRYLKLVQADAENAHRRASPADNWNL